ncbi:MAG: hypothetical protein IJ588_11470 [Prevotella sp.]|nr:hypothetical protein [Prevotella sp.]
MRQFLLTLACLLVGTAMWADDTSKATADSLTIDSLRHANDSLRQTVDSLQRELSDLSQFRTEFIKDRLLRQSPDLQKPFSQSDAAEIDAYILRLTPFKGNQEIDEQLARVETYKQYLTLYHHYSRLLQMPFARQGITDATTDITKNLKGKAGSELTEAQFNDFDTLAIYMSRYYPGAKDFQALIRDVDAKLKNYKGNTDEASRDFCRELVQKVLAQYEETVQKRIMNIPYLRQRYDVYTASLLANPLSLTKDAGDAVSDINNLKLD